MIIPNPNIEFTDGKVSQHYHIKRNDGLVHVIYTTHFHPKIKMWKMNSEYIKVDEDELYTYSQIVEFERDLKKQTPQIIKAINIDEQLRTLFH